MQHDSTDAYPSDGQHNKKSKALKRVGILFLSLVALVFIGYSVWLFVQNRDISSKLSRAESNNKQLNSENEKLKSSNAQPQSEAINVTEELHGKMASYPLTQKTSNVLLWTSSPGEKGEYITLSHKAYSEFMSSQDKEYIYKVCGTANNLKAIQEDQVYGMLNTSTKKISFPQNGMCLQLFASSENQDSASRAKAQTVINEIKSDIDTFVSSAEIK
jgi:hypothetical protein